MDWTFLAAVALTVLSVVGYVLGTVAPYPGREATIVGLCVGVTLAAVTAGRRRSVTGDGATAGDGVKATHDADHDGGERS